MNEVTKRLDVYDEKQQRWRHVKVLTCILKWIENGTVAQITHQVQEYDDFNVLTGEPYECNLTTSRYFISALQDNDESAKLSFKERRAWEDRLQALQVSHEATIQEAEASIKAYQAEREHELREVYEREWSIETNIIREETNIYFTTPPSKDALKAEMDIVNFEIRRGTVKVIQSQRSLTSFSSKSLEKQVVNIAKERILQRRLEDRKKGFNQRFREQHVKALETQLVQRQKHLQTLKQSVSKAMAAELEVFAASLRVRREALMKRVRFDPVVFSKAVPTATMCEHTK
jgi:hypothetical protein